MHMMGYLNQQIRQAAKTLQIEIRRRWSEFGFLQKELNEVSREVGPTSARDDFQESHGQAKPPIAVRIEVPPAEANKEDARKNGTIRRDRIRLMVEVGGLALGGVLAGATLVQLVLTKQAVNIAAVSARASEESVKTAQRGVEATQRSVDSSIENYYRDQRAWVGLDGFGTPVLDDTKPFTVFVRLKNTGKTPALDVTFLTQVDPMFNGEKPKFRFDLKPYSRGVLQPEGTVTATLHPVKSEFGNDERPSKKTLEQINSGELRVYVYGKVTYRDIFNREHWTKFCSILQKGGSGYETCDTFNDVDREKKR